MAVGGRRQRCCDRPTLVVWLVALCWCTDIVAADFDAHQVATHPTTSEFSKHAQLKPRIYHGREKRQISSTREETSNDHVHHITVDYDLDDENYILDLRLNDALVPQGYFVRTQENGRHAVNRPKQEEVELCHYHGRVRDRPKSWVALSTCNDTLRGVVYDGTEIHYVEHHDGEHRAYKHSDYTPMGKRTCGYAGGPHNDDHDDHEHSVLDNRILRYKRSTTETLVRGPYNANKQSRYVELVFVVDNRQFKELDENVKVVEHHCKDIANIINAIYSPLNIYIALVGVVIWTDFDEIVFSSNGDTTLTNFLHYRRETLIKEHPNDNAQLLTKFTFDNGVVGKALKGPICTYEYSGGVNTEHSNVLGLVATTVAHEMGHNFGMEHDTNECSCADEKCIMAPSSSPIPPTHWSSCSLDYLALAFEHGMDYCLRNKPARLFDSPVCGNGFVEPGEQCDCGLPEHCDNTCCNATACMLYANASCATGECCDLATCMPKNAGTMCRSADYECDLPEYCTGQSEYCPDDIYKMDTESCDNGRAYCYHGFCRTRSDQCKLLWGNTGKSSDDQCYKMNTKGTRHGNCGYNKLNQSYFRCNDENVMCGMLHCKHLNERLEFGMESVAILSHSFINLKGSIIPCRTAIVDLGLNQVDPGLAPDGAICGEGRMCVNQKCMAVDSLRLSIGGCPNDCNGHGVCNSMGHCHCENGFAPPDCEYPGPGGSADSGPAEDPNRHRVVVNAMFIFFLGIVPLVTLCGFAYYYIRHNMGGAPALKKSPATQKSPPKTRSPPFSPESPKKAAEDNHCLLSAENSTQDDFFGQFKGYSITPIKKSPSRPEEKPLGVVRPAPQVPKIAAVAPTVKRTNTIRSPEALPGSMVSAPIKGVATTSAEPPALPPLNPGAHPRPIISSPTLQNSTCTAKELISPLRNAPKVPTTITQEGTHRVAPAPPIIALKEVKIEEPAHVPTPQVTFAPVTTSQLHLGKEKKTALNRIASFLKPEKKSPKVPKPFIEKDLRSVDISGPIPQADRPTPEKPVARSHSMKTTEPITKPKLQSFGSMRDPSKRPVSMVGSRPKSPPPPAPNVNAPEATPPKNKALSQTQNQYDDCLNAPLAQSESTSPSSDNIYAVIEDNPVSPASPASLQSPQSPPSKNASNSTSNESFGLLGEIVSEIQNRNFDSIYSTSTLARKKKERERAIANGEVPPDDAKDAGPLYENTQNIQDPHDTESVGTAEGEYSNMSRAYENSASSTSSGYIHPSAVNRPKYDNPIVSKQPPSTATEAKALASFKKPISSASMVVREAPRPPVAPTTQNTPAAKTPPTTQVTRQVTPTNLKTRKASPTRPKSMVGSAAAAAKPQTSVKPSVALNKPATTAKPVISGPKGLKTTSNSPDLVSCSTPPKSATQKAPPDVLNGAKKPLQTKKSAGKLTAATVGGANSVTSSASKGKIFPVKNSTVASLQQKFENKT